MNRRDFLKLSALTAAGIGSIPAAPTVITGGTSPIIPAYIIPLPSAFGLFIEEVQKQIAESSGLSREIIGEYEYLSGLRWKNE